MTDDTHPDGDATPDGPSVPAADGGDGPPATDDPGDSTRADGEADPRERMQAALREVRREGQKVAVVYALVDAAAVALTANLLLSVLGLGWPPAQVAVPSAVAGAVGASGATLPGPALVAAVLGLVAFAGEVAYRTRQPLVEQFEAVNPPVAESLRTARDALADGADSRMARRLYGDVLAGLRESSTLGLVDARRVGAALAVVLVVSVLTVQAAVADLALVGGAESAANDTGPAADANFTGLRDGDQVLGAPGEVAAGNRTATARVESTGGGQEVQGESFPEVAGGGPGTGDGGGVEGEQAGFTDPEAVEEADLVREYNQRIRETTPTDDD